MSFDINWMLWTEAGEQPPAGQDPAAAGATPPPGMGTDVPVPPGGAPPQPLMGSGATGQDQSQGGEPPQDPNTPEMPEDYGQQQQGPGTQFEAWKKEFYRLGIKGDPQEMLNSLARVRELDNLEVPQRRFVDDNYHILRYRQNANMDAASKDIRKLISDSLDRNRPGSTVMQYIYSTTTAGKVPQLREIMAKFPAFHGTRGDYHRKHVAALIGAAQVGGGGSGPDLLYSGKDFSINISTRFYQEFGRMQLVDWALQRRDPEIVLSDSEREKLEDGSPEEKQVLRRRIVIESISRRLEGRSFLINVVETEGAAYYLGWDASEGLLSGYNEGKIVVRSKGMSDTEAIIDGEGDIVPVVNVDILYLKDTGTTDEAGRPKFREVPFMSRIDGQLYLTAAKETLRDLATGMSGLFFQEDPWVGQPQDLKVLQRSIPSLEEILMRGPQ